MKKINKFEVTKLVYSWGGYKFRKKIKVFDTTLRDGLQSPQAQRQPKLSEKLSFLEASYKLGIEAIEIGFPVASLSHRKDVIELAKHADKNKMKILLSCLARTTIQDIEAVADVAQKSGTKITANILIGSSKIRRLVEDWDLPEMIDWISKTISLAHKYGLQVEFVTEDTTRTDPLRIAKLYKTAIKHGVKRIWIADTVGTATPNSAKKITEYFTKKIIGEKAIGLDWHGHDDKGLGVANSLAAAEAGADRIQATALGVGERAGNTPMEPVIINLYLANHNQYKLEHLYEYSKTASRMYNIEIRNSYPGIGKYVHTTAAGMHAAAILKARKLKREDLVGVVYGPFHPNLFGKEVEIYIGPMSGSSNVEWNLKRLGLTATPEEIDKILQSAKLHNRFLTDEEVKNVIRRK